MSTILKIYNNTEYRIQNTSNTDRRDTSRTALDSPKKTVFSQLPHSSSTFLQFDSSLFLSSPHLIHFFLLFYFVCFSFSQFHLLSLCISYSPSSLLFVLHPIPHPNFSPKSPDSTVDGLGQNPLTTAHVTSAPYFLGLFFFFFFSFAKRLTLQRLHFARLRGLNSF